MHLASKRHHFALYVCPTLFFLASLATIPTPYSTLHASNYTTLKQPPSSKLLFLHADEDPIGFQISHRESYIYLFVFIFLIQTILIFIPQNRLFSIYTILLFDLWNE